ncbi:MAG: glycosyltransferase family A protein [bacterium]
MGEGRSVSRSGPLGIGVVIPVFDRPRQMLEALDTIACQLRAPDRVVVVDDGSREPVESAVDDWRAANRPHFELRVLRQANRGAAHARNRGLEHLGPAEMVAFLDSDDRWPEDFLQRTAANLEDDREAVAATADRLFVEDRCSGRAELRASGRIGIDATCFLLHEGGGVGSATLFRADAIRAAGGYDARLPTGHDSALFLRVSLLGSWRHAAGAPVRYRVQRGGCTDGESDESDHLRMRYPDFRRRWARIDEDFLRTEAGRHRVPSSFQRRHLARRWRMAGTQLLAAGERLEARSCFVRALAHRWQLKTLREIIRTFVPGRPGPSEGLRGA